MVSWRDGVCSICVLKIHHQDNFDKHASTRLQLVHSDLCGPLLVVLFSGFKYLLTSIGDYPRCTCVYFLKLKSEVFEMFLAYNASLKINIAMKF